MNALRSSILAAALAVAVLACAPVVAGTIWDGGGANDFWTTGANWDGIKFQQTPPPNNGTANIHMAGTVRRTPVVNVPYSIASLTFDRGSAAFVILGYEQLTIGAGGVKNYDDDIQTVIGPMRLAANQTWYAIAGRLQMDEVNLNGFDLSFAGAFRTDMIGVIHGAGDLLLPDAYASTVTMLAPNMYSGTTTVAGGTLVLKKTTSGGVTIPGPLVIGGGSITPLATVRLEANEQISQAPGIATTVLGGGLLDVNSRTETLAELLVTGGGEVTVGNGGRLSLSEAVVTGPGSSLEHGYGSTLYVGEVGVATLDILAGGEVTGGLAYVGYGSGSTGVVAVDGAGSTWDASFNLGYRGLGVLNITDGGTVIGGGTIGYLPGSSGFVNVDGEGSLWNIGYGGSLFLGYQGAGYVNVTASGDVYSGDTTIGFHPGSSGFISIDGFGSEWYSAGNIQIAFGELAVTNDGRVVTALPLLVNSQGTLSGNSLVESNFVYNGGRVEPGPAADALTINGYYIQQPYGTLEIELGGANAFDELLVPLTGTIASLDGTLEVKLIDGFTPLIGQTFTIVSAYDVDGMFSTLDLPDMVGRRFEVIYNPQSVVLRVVLDLGAGVAAARSVPEPGGLALVVVGAWGLAVARLRNQLRHPRR